MRIFRRDDFQTTSQISIVSELFQNLAIILGILPVLTTIYLLTTLPLIGMCSLAIAFGFFLAIVSRTDDDVYATIRWPFLNTISFGFNLLSIIAIMSVSPLTYSGVLTFQELTSIAFGIFVLGQVGGALSTSVKTSHLLIQIVLCALIAFVLWFQIPTLGKDGRLIDPRKIPEKELRKAEENEESKVTLEIRIVDENGHLLETEDNSMLTIWIRPLYPNSWPLEPGIGGIVLEKIKNASSELSRSVQYRLDGYFIEVMELRKRTWERKETATVKWPLPGEKRKILVKFKR